MKYAWVIDARDTYHFAVYVNTVVESDVRVGDLIWWDGSTGCGRRWTNRLYEKYDPQYQYGSKHPWFGIVRHVSQNPCEPYFDEHTEMLVAEGWDEIAENRG